MGTSVRPEHRVEIRGSGPEAGASAGARIAGDRRRAFTDYFRAIAHSC